MPFKLFFLNYQLLTHKKCNQWISDNVKIKKRKWYNLKKNIVSKIEILKREIKRLKSEVKTLISKVKNFTIKL